MIRSVLVGSVAAILIGGGVANASSISILNPSFEDPGDTGAQPRAVTDWVQVGGVNNSGVWNINTFPQGFWNVGVVAPDGNQIAFVSEAPQPGTQASISQVLGASLLANTTYTLSGYVGSPIGFGGGSGGNGLTQYRVELRAGGSLLTFISGVGPEGTFAPFSLVYDSLNTGGLLEIVLSSNQPQSGFDKISLDAVDDPISAVPEPGTLSLLGLGLTAVASRFRKRIK